VQEGGDDFFAGMDADDRARTTEAAASLSTEQLNRLMEIFKTHDADGSGEFDVRTLHAPNTAFAQRLRNVDEREHACGEKTLMYTGMRRHITNLLCVEVYVDVRAVLFAAGARAARSYERSWDRPHSACECCVFEEREQARVRERGLTSTTTSLFG